MLSAVRPWLALLALLALFELPDLLLNESVRPAADLLVLLAAYVLSLRLGFGIGRVVRFGLLLYAILLVLYRIDRAAFLAFMGQEPLIYDQVLMLRHLFVLFSDLWSWKVGAILAGVPVATVIIVWLVRKLLRELRPFAYQPRQRLAALVVGGLVCASTALGDGLPVVGSHVPRWLSPGLLANLQTSQGIYASVQRQLRTSPYRVFDKLKLQRRPDVYLILVESYGRVLVDRGSMHRLWVKQIETMERTLSSAGWHSASAFSVAPVAGGRSWLAEASVMMGIHVDYEAVFHHLIGQIERIPNLVSLLAKQGYHTLLLAPSDRVRKGIEEANYYNYQRMVRFLDLDYRGPVMGWGIVPDQYSLYHTDEHVLRRAPRPLFFNYHMVTSHAPFRPVPQLVEDWRTLSNPDGPPHVEGKKNALGMRMRRYPHAEPRFMPLGTLRSKMGRDYTAAILYDLELLQRYLEGLTGDALVIVMGDHQPPFIAPETSNFEVPIHLFARDPALLAEFREQGFKDGLMLNSEDTATVRHEGLFSLIVRALARCCGPGGAPLPTYRAEGTRF